MKIRDRLSLSFSAVASITLLVFGLAVYFFFALYRKSEFNNRLKQRIEVTEKLFLERDNFSEESFRTIQQQFLNKLPEETEEVIELTDSFKDELQQQYPDEFLAALLDKNEAFFELNNIQGAGRLFHVQGRDYLVLITAVDYVGTRLMDHFLTIIFIGLAVCIFAMLPVSHIVSSRLLNSITNKIRKANSISAKNLHERLVVANPDDELGQLAIAFNSLLDRVAEAFERQRSFIDGASHEIRNPLTAIMGEADYALQRSRTPEEYVQSLRTVSEEADRLNTLVNHLLTLSNLNNKSSSFPIESFSLRDLL
ncbi:MAG: histidine kinase dimerization/phospho-acceptor domain-containing protein, partial [Cyclobacteriaceae bacterium]